MSTQLAPTNGRHDHPPQPTRSPESRPVRRVSALDRAAMHLGLALVRWGRRPKARRRERPVPSPEELQARRERQQLLDQHLVLKLTQFR